MMKNLLLAGAIALASTSAHAAVIYDRYNRAIYVAPAQSITQGNTRFWYRNGVYLGRAIHHGSGRTTVIEANGTRSTIIRYSNGSQQSWDARGRPQYHTYGYGR